MNKRTYSCDIKMRVFQVKEAKGPFIQCAKDIAAIFKDIKTMNKEAMFAITLTQKNQQIDRHMISLGTLTASLIHPRAAFMPAFQDCAAAIAFCHNHPSGVVSPSKEDIAITKRLAEAGELLGIRVLDHVIIGRNGYLSFVDEGLL